MAALIEDYALVGDMHSAALISRDGAVGWLCVPRYCRRPPTDKITGGSPARPG